MEIAVSFSVHDTPQMASEWAEEREREMMRLLKYFLASE
jgi:hypothetical protein